MKPTIHEVGSTEVQRYLRECKEREAERAKSSRASRIALWVLYLLGVLFIGWVALGGIVVPK